MRRDSKKSRINENLKRTVNPEIISNSKAKNLLSISNAPKTTNKVNFKKKIGKSPIKKKKRQSKFYSESSLNIPELNRSINPSYIKKKGKKIKVFVNDNDSLVYNRIIKLISDKYDQINETKLEKSLRLEEIRELKRKELERKKKADAQKLEKQRQEMLKTSLKNKTGSKTLVQNDLLPQKRNSKVKFS